MFVQAGRKHFYSAARRLLCLALCLAVLLPGAAMAAEKTRVTAYLLRLRAKPSTKAEVIDAYPRGTEVTILKKGAEWTKVRVHGKTGFMQTKSLAYGKSSSSGANNTDGSTMYVLKGVWLNVRAEPDSGSDILTTLRGGTAVTVLKKGKYWTKISVKGIEGYAGSDYLTAVKGE